ncbi:MAG TPA: hypothetical protein VFT60_06860 [Bryobacteraceae bacterium]|jgi:hypothetical protein|nr:hypothetical protein [Bryobacteraceae bacterium]
MSRFWPAVTALFGAAALFVSAATVTESADRKFAHIESARLPAGTRIDFSIDELNAWANQKARIYAPGAARNLRLELRDGEATGYALVDFLKLRRAASGEEPGWIVRNLFSGERPVMVKARVQSYSRRARVDVERVEVSGVPIQGSALDFLIRNWLRPTFPDAHVNEWFNLGLRIERFTVRAGGASVFVGR